MKKEVNIDKVKIAHRGLHNKKNPENSLGAFKRSIKANLPIEFDVHILKDDSLVVFHDDNLKRMTGLNKDIKDLTYPEIKDLKLKSTKEKIPTLREVLNLVGGRVLLDIEIKTDVKSKKICKLLAKELDSYKGKYMVKSFDPRFIAWFKKNRPNVFRGLLISNSARYGKLTKFCLSWFCMNLYCKPNFLAIQKNLMNDKRVNKYKDKGIKILIWTIRDTKWYETDGIIFEDRENV